MNAVSGTIRPYCLKEEIWSSVPRRELNPEKK